MKTNDQNRESQPVKPPAPPPPPTNSLIQSFTPSIPRNHLTIGLSNTIAQSKQYDALFTHRRLPSSGWSDFQIRSFLMMLSALDTNSVSAVCGSDDDDGDGDGDGDYGGGGGGGRRWCGIGEREGRVYSNLVAERSFGLAHGMGRSGDITEPQPKACGSSVIAELTRCLVLDAMRRGSGLDGSCYGGKRGRKGKGGGGKEEGGGDVGSGGGPARFGIVLPLCTGMAMSLLLGSLRQTAAAEDRERQEQDSGFVPVKRDIVLWSRIDQKSCLKAITSAGLTCIPIPTTTSSPSTHSITTSLPSLLHLLQLHSPRILAVVSTTSCFAPRVADRIDEIARLCREWNVAHVVNNAYGLQCERIGRLVNRATVVGRVDGMVCSMDKNFLVPVGGAIVTSPQSSTIQAIGKLYAGRASSAPIVDLFITLLSMGLNGYRRMLERRKKLVVRFEKRLEEVATKYGEKVLRCPENTISFGMTLDSLAEGVTLPSTEAAAPSGENEGEEKDSEMKLHDKKAEITSLFGSMLFTRCVSGTRVVPRFRTKVIEGHTFKGFGSSTDDFPHAYLTAACAIGLSGNEMEEFFRRLDRCFKDFFGKRKKEEEKEERRRRKKEEEGTAVASEVSGSGVES